MSDKSFFYKDKYYSTMEEFMDAVKAHGIKEVNERSFEKAFKDISHTIWTNMELYNVHKLNETEAASLYEETILACIKTFVFERLKEK